MNINEKRRMITLPGVRTVSTFHPAEITVRTRNVLAKAIRTGFMSVGYSAASGKLWRMISHAENMPFLRQNVSYSSGWLTFRNLPPPVHALAYEYLAAQRAANMLSDRGAAKNYFDGFLAGLRLNDGAVNYDEVEYAQNVIDAQIAYCTSNVAYIERAEALIAKLKAGTPIAVPHEAVTAPITPEESVVEGVIAVTKISMQMLEEVA